MGIRRHNKRDWTDDAREVIRPTYEKISVEIFSYEHKLSKFFLPKNLNIQGTNHAKTSHRSLKVYKSKDSKTSFTLEFEYNAKETGDYRIDVLYENRNAKDYVGEYDLSLTEKKSSKLYNNVANVASYETQLAKLNKKIKTINKLLIEESKKKNASKKIAIKYESEITKAQKQIDKINAALNKVKRIDGKTIKFDGELNILKRKTIFVSINELGKHTLTLELPVNCYFVGLAFRKLKVYRGDNLDTTTTNLSFTEATISKSGQVKPAEASFEIAYDNDFECDLTRTGFYFNYMDEVNIYVKENAKQSNTEMVQRFGGYISTINEDKNRARITFACADRLLDGEAKFILDSLLIQHGTTSESESEYNKPINFNSYGQALKYLCDIHEITLKSNIKKNYLVDGEKYNKGFSIKFGKKKDIKKIVVKNGRVKEDDNYITLRNNPSGQKPQSFLLYDAKAAGAKKPVQLKKVIDNEIETNNLTFHLTYGLGDPAKSNSSEDYTDSTDGSLAGAQKFSKCGVSQDKKYLMAIGTTSSAKDSGSYGTYYKQVFKNYCPHCEKEGVLVWDSCRSDTNCVTTGSWGGSKRSWGVAAIETEITCNSCDSDYSVQGNEKDSPWAKLKSVSPLVKSSQAEQTKLHKGNMVAVPTSAASEVSMNAIEYVAKKLKKYKYQLGVSSSYSDMKRTGIGDCWAFSDAIFTELKKLKVGCKIFQYATSLASNHRTVVYKNAKGEWVDFPYRKYGFHSWLVPTSNRPNPKSKGNIANYNGGRAGDVNVKGESTTSKTSVTTTVGYDKDKPFNAFIELVYSTDQRWSAKKKKIYINWTQKAGTNSDINGLPAYWVNNSQRQVSIDMKDYFADNEPNRDIFLHSIRFIAPKLAKNNDAGTDTNWYAYDKSNHDHASCKMDLYQIIFDDRAALNPTDLQSCGKTVNAMMEELVTASKYRVSMEYGKHRKDDVILFSVDKRTKPVFTATEGDNNNILEWSNISCSPVSVLRNSSIMVYKSSKNKYSYVDTREAQSLLEFGEQSVLQTNTEINGSKEAYFNARSAKEYNPEFDYSYTIVVPYAPNLQLGDYVEVISNYKYLNDIKPIESIQIKYANGTKPTIQTTLGLGEIEPYLRIKREMQLLRRRNKEKTTFSSSAQPVDDADIYVWEQ